MIYNYKQIQFPTKTIKSMTENTHLKTFVIDNLSPETIAMLQALYSRSASSVEEHLKKVEKTGSDKFMESFYVGYGHASIGDCGTTTTFIENVSILADKSIQDNWDMVTI